MSPSDSRYSLRPAQPSDLEFCRAAHHEGLRQYVEPLWGWEPEFQDRRFVQKFVTESVRIVLDGNGREVGYVETKVEGANLHVTNIILLPSARGQGLGSRLLREILLEASARGLQVELNVLNNNPARRLYEREGFVLVGEDDSLCSYVWKESTRAPSRSIK